jgi:hypothetical protein
MIARRSQIADGDLANPFSRLAPALAVLLADARRRAAALPAT